MTKNQIIKFLEAGAEFHKYDAKFVHPSFPNGFKVMHQSNKPWNEVVQIHGCAGSNRLFCFDGVVKIRGTVSA